jgi:predicted NACHT family NTPase
MLLQLVQSGLSITQTAATQRASDADMKENKAIQRKIDAELKKDKPKKSRIRGLEKDLEASRIFDIVATPSAIVDGILRNHKASSQWAETISFADSPRNRKLAHVYIHLDLFVYPVRVRISETENVERFPFDEFLERTERHTILLGDAGAGKTTSMKYLFSKLIQTEKISIEGPIPMVLRFRDMFRQVKRSDGNNPKATMTDPLSGGVILKELSALLGIRLKFDGRYETNEKTVERTEAIEKVLFDLLDTLGLVLILDGFDEIPYHDARETSLAEIRSLALNLKKSRMIVTCRAGEFNYTIDNVKPFQVAPLDFSKIDIFAHKWLGNSASAKDFLDTVRDSPFGDTTIRPLTLAHLCAIYERTGRIPDKPKTIYRKIVYLLLEEWDEQWSVIRPSKYASFFPDRKAEFLGALAFQLTAHFGSTTFDKQRLKEVYLAIHASFDLPKDEVREVINEIEDHTGLFLQTGFDLFEFAHKSLQEYLAAEYLVKLPILNFATHHLERLPNELAIATSLSSDPSGFLAHLVLNILTSNQCSQEFFEAFITRVVQESPDFSVSVPLSLTLPVLAALWACNGKLTAKSRTRDVPQDALQIYSTFVSTYLKRSKVPMLDGFYVKDSSRKTENWISFRRVERLDGYRLPTTLWLHSEFVEAMDAMQVEFS